MAIRNHASLAAAPGNAVSSGDGGPGYSEITPSERMSAAVGAESDHSDVAAYQRAKQAASGIEGSGGSGFTVGASGDLVVNDMLSKNSNVVAGGLSI